MAFSCLAWHAAEPFLEELAAFRERLATGRKLRMPWLTEARAELACSPDTVLPGAASVIVLGMSYWAGEQLQAPASDALDGAPAPDEWMSEIVARYARGRDYHNVLRPKLRLLVRELERLYAGPVRARLFVDSGPFVERAAARRAGLGWIGKNTLLLNKRAGSWTLLAAIITDVPLTADAPVRTDCGSCRRCLDACPTGALPEPFTALDASRCISYLTIENRGAIDPALRPNLGNLIFGCDICQEVCPVNRRPLPVQVPDLKPRPPLTGNPDLLSMLSLDEASFNQLFAGSPVRRAKRSGFVRNVAVACGNAGDPRAVPSLRETLLNDVDPVVRGHAAWALGCIGGKAAEAALAEAAADHDSTVMQEVANALASLN